VTFGSIARARLCGGAIVSKGMSDNRNDVDFLPGFDSGHAVK